MSWPASDAFKFKMFFIADTIESISGLQPQHGE